MRAMRVAPPAVGGVTDERKREANDGMIDGLALGRGLGRARLRGDNESGEGYADRDGRE